MDGAAAKTRLARWEKWGHVVSRCTQLETIRRGWT